MTNVVLNIRKSGITVKDWSAKRGFVYQTVLKVISGTTGKRKLGISEKILKRLKKDGFMEEAA